MPYVWVNKSNPQSSDVHIDGPLTNIAVAYMQDASRFIADRVFPNVPSGKQSDKYFIIPRGAFNRDEMEKRSEAAETKGVEYEVSNDNFFCDVWGLHHDVPDQRRANMDAPLNEDRQATEFLSRKALIKREKEWVTNFFTSSKWTTDLTPGNLWSDYTNSTPFEDIETAIETIEQSTGFTPNTLVLGRQVWGKLKNHPDFVARVNRGQTSGAARPTLADLAELLEMDRILISRAIENTAKAGATASHSFIAGKHALVCYSAPNPGVMVPSAGYTFSWNGYLGAGAAGQRISKFRMQHLRADRVEVEMAFDQKLISADLGYFFASVVS